MENFNIAEVDFFNLDIDKYLDWLISKYKLFASLHTIVLLDDIINKYSAKKFYANSHYIITRGKPLPDKIERLYNDKIEHFTKEKDKYKTLKTEVILFESVLINRQQSEIKEYGFFSRDEMQNIKIDISSLLYWIETESESQFNELIEEIEEKRNRTPQTDILFYKKELTNLINDFEFNYLPQILDGQFIYNLDNFKNSLAFALEIDKIRLAIYLSEKIAGKTAIHQPTKPIQWTANLNTLVTIFNELLTSNVIKNERGTKENIKRILLNNFVNNDGLELSKNSIDEVFNPSKMKTDKTTIQLLKPLLEHLQKK